MQNVKKAAKSIVDNLNEISTATKSKKKGKDYLAGGKSVIKTSIPAVKSDIGDALEDYIEKQTEGVKKSSKKIKANVEIKK